MQLRFQCDLTGEDYVTREAWREATLERCPLHPRGGCRFRRHGTYPRLTPPGTRVARWYCRDGHSTFSLLPDCLAARLPATLAEVEEVIVALEQAPSVERAVADMRPEVALPGVLRWARRRAHHVYAALVVLRGLMPELFEGLAPNIGAWRARQGCIPVLVSLRTTATIHLAGLPAPLGFRPHPCSGGQSDRRAQQPMGPDPPRLVR